MNRKITLPSLEEDIISQKDIPNISNVLNEATLHVTLLEIPLTSPKRIKQMIKYINYHYNFGFDFDILECTNIDILKCTNDDIDNINNILKCTNDDIDNISNILKCTNNNILKCTNNNTKCTNDDILECNYCNIVNVKLLSCSYCFSIMYCSQECQKNDWKKKHKKICKKNSNIVN